jgi:hypothetical protein
MVDEKDAMILFWFTTPKCVLIHFGFHEILNEFEHFT